MRTFFAQAALLWPLLTTAFPFPSPSSSQASDQSAHIQSAAGSTSHQEVSVRFSIPCQGCFIGTDDGLAFDLTIARAETECGSVLPLVNGVPLAGPQTQDHGRGHGVLQTKLVNGLGQREIYAIWETLCVPEQGQVLSFSIHNIGQDKVNEPSGFTASFKQQGRPEILRLEGEPVDLEEQDIDRLHSWITPPPSLRLTVEAPDTDHNLDEILEDQFRELAVLNARARQIEAVIYDKKNEIKQIVHREFRSTIESCPGIRCVVQTTFKNVPKVIQLIGDYFHRTRPSSPIVNKCTFTSASLRADFVNETRSLDDDLDEPGVDLGKVPHTAPHPNHDQLEGSTLRHGDAPPPAPPPGSRPPEPPSPPSPPPPPEYQPDFHDTPSSPHSPPHHRHRHPHGPKLLKRIMFIIVLSTLASLLFRHLRHNNTLSRCYSRSADRACSREERRSIGAHRGAALQHRWSTWWNRYRRPASTADYDEKRNLILQQEGILEDAMQDELRVLRSAQQIVEEIYDAEEGRSRLYCNVNQRQGAVASTVELPAVGSSSGRRRDSASSMYTLPPPGYEEELDADVTVADGFQYTPTGRNAFQYTPSGSSAFQYTPSSSSAYDDTPDSSVVDCSPRMSCDTGRTMVTREDERDERPTE